jgi:hypothetical protein
MCLRWANFQEACCGNRECGDGEGKLCSEGVLGYQAFCEALLMISDSFALRSHYPQFSLPFRLRESVPHDLLQLEGDCGGLSLQQVVGLSVVDGDGGVAGEEEGEDYGKIPTIHINMPLRRYGVDWQIQDQLGFSTMSLGLLTET